MWQSWYMGTRVKCGDIAIEGRECVP